MIKELHLNNFKKHGHRSFYFTEGLNGIFGANYTGKTTILYGILYALGGASQVPGTNLQKVGTNTGMCVKMLMTINEVDYLIDRKKTGAYLYQGSDLLLASGTSNVNNKVMELIGMPIKRFRQLKYAEQKRSHSLLTLGAAELHKIIEELTGIDQINLALLKLKDIISEAKGALEVLDYEDPESMYIEEEDLAIKLGGLKHDEQKAEECVTKTVETLLTAEDKFEKLLQDKEANDAERIAVARIQGTKEVREMDLKSTWAQLGALESLEDAESELVSSEAKLSDLEKEFEQCKNFSNEMDRLSREKSKVDRFITGTVNLIESDTKDLEIFPVDAQQRVIDAQTLYSEENRKLDNAQWDFSNKTEMLKSSRCPTCEREYEDGPNISSADVIQAEEVVDSLSKSVRQAKERVREAKAIFSARETSIADLETNTKALEKSNKELSEIEWAIRTIDEDPIYKERHLLKPKVDSEKTRRDGWKDEVREVKAFQSNRDSLLKEIDDLSEQLSNRPVPPKFDAEEYTKLKSFLPSAKTSVELKQKELADIREKSYTTDTDLMRLREKIAEVVIRNQSYDEYKARHGTATELTKFLRANRDRYTSEIWGFFMASATNFVSACTSGNIEEIQRTEGGQFQFVEDSQVMGIKDASGAQESIMGLAVQMALAEAAQCPLDILLVDEPTADMDADHSMAVAGILSTKGNQIIAISHREMDSSLCQNVINM